MGLGHPEKTRFPKAGFLVGLRRKGRERELSPRGERPGGCGQEGSRPSAGGDRWEDTKRRASGKTDGWGREERRLGVGGTVVGG